MKKKTTMTVTDIRFLAEGICSMTLRYPEGEAPEEVRPGQFAGLYPNDADKLLPRPISICRWDPEKKELRFVFRVAGAGTASLAAQKAGDTVDMLGVLGNGYDTDKLAGKKVLLLGGGIGVPPMLELAAALSKMPKGNVLDAVREHGVKAQAVCACGPMPMLRAVKRYAMEEEIPAYLSLEERMACGVGACLGCVTKTAKVDGHSHVRNARICTEGPVFGAEEVEIG